MEISVVFPSDTEGISEKNLHQVRPFSTYNSITERGREICAIVAMGKGSAIGREGGIPWRLPEDMAHFKGSTMGHPVIMGRKTWESLPKRPLPGRRNMVVTRNPEYASEGAEVFHSVEEAIGACEASEVPFIIGGAQIYDAALPCCSKIIVTEVDTVVPDADALFPEIKEEEWKVSDRSETMTSKTGLTYRFVTYLRR